MGRDHSRNIHVLCALHDSKTELYQLHIIFTSPGPRFGGTMAITVVLAIGSDPWLFELQRSALRSAGYFVTTVSTVIRSPKKRFRYRFTRIVPVGRDAELHHPLDANVRIESSCDPHGGYRARGGGANLRGVGLRNADESPQRTNLPKDGQGSCQSGVRSGLQVAREREVGEQRDDDDCYQALQRQSE
jgi:hypothetical protein